MRVGLYGVPCWDMNLLRTDLVCFVHCVHIVDTKEIITVEKE